MWTVDGEIRSWKQMPFKIVTPFDAEFEQQEHETEEPGADATSNKPAAVASLDEANANAKNETACQQDYRVHRADEQFGLLRAGVEPWLVPMARIDPGEKKGAEEQHFGGQEQPHPR